MAYPICYRCRWPMLPVADMYAFNCLGCGHYLTELEVQSSILTKYLRSDGPIILTGNWGPH